MPLLLPLSNADGQDAPMRLARCALVAIAFSALGLTPNDGTAANLINTMPFTNSAGESCVKQSFDDGSDIINCSSTETKIIDVPVPTFEPLPSGSPAPGGGETTGGGGTGSPPPSGDTVLGDPVRDGGGETTTGGKTTGGGNATGGGSTVTNRGEQNRRRQIEADQARRKSGSRAKDRLRYDDVDRPDEDAKPKRRDRDWGRLSDQIGRLGKMIRESKERDGERDVLGDPLRPNNSDIDVTGGGNKEGLGNYTFGEGNFSWSDDSTRSGTQADSRGGVDTGARPDGGGTRSGGPSQGDARQSDGIREGNLKVTSGDDRPSGRGSVAMGGNKGGPGGFTFETSPEDLTVKNLPLTGELGGRDSGPSFSDVLPDDGWFEPPPNLAGRHGVVEGPPSGPTLSPGYGPGGLREQSSKMLPLPGSGDGSKPPSFSDVPRERGAEWAQPPISSLYESGTVSGPEKAPGFAPSSPRGGAVMIFKGP